jgi:hypothetical protein
MTRGILIFAHNNRDVDYALMSVISGGLAKKHLSLPVSLVTDQTTLDWIKESGIQSTADAVFDKIITVDRPITDNARKLHDGIDGKVVPFVNLNRNDAYSLTPYDQTLLIDSDFLIFSDNLNNYWEYSDRVLLGQSINDVIGKNRLGYHDLYISDTGPHLYWATTIMFTKNEYSKNFFSILSHVKENYDYFSDLYRFYVKNYRNDIAFSIAQHIMDGNETQKEWHLPPVFSFIDKDILHSVEDNSKLTFLVYSNGDNFCASAVKNTDVHVMNKASIIRNAKKLLELI